VAPEQPALTLVASRLRVAERAEQRRAETRLGAEQPVLTLVVPRLQVAAGEEPQVAA
jgi:hypothetical protein